jgi:hypothetical protein
MKTGSYPMNTHECFSSSIYIEEEHGEEQELSGFTGEVTKQFGPEQAKVSERDWLDESDFMDSPPLSTRRNWHAVTVAASARLENRMSVATPQKAPKVTL